MADEAHQIEPEALDEESVLQERLASPHSRLAGGTEYSWCRAVSGGTGITVLALLFSKPLDTAILQQVMDRVQCNHPRLRSQLVWVRGRPAFLVKAEPVAKLEVVRLRGACMDSSELQMSLERGEDKARDDSPGERAEEDGSTTEESVKARDWLSIVEVELNINEWSEQHHCLNPVPMFFVRLYELPHEHSLLVFRVHTAVCDRASGATILKEMLSLFYQLKHGFLPLKRERQLKGNAGKVGVADDKPELASCTADTVPFNFIALEDVIPEGKSHKPFWAHGLDMLGYSLGSRRHAMLPFTEVTKSRYSAIVRLSLNEEYTQQLLEMCNKQRTTCYGAINAAGLKATARIKRLGSRSEHYAVITLIDCRNHLDATLLDSTVGFYHSAVLNTHALSESVEFWDLARRCTFVLQNSLKNRKHFTDIGDLNYLMCQAIQFPHLTPASSLRTSLMTLFEDTLFDDIEDLKEALALEDYIGCSSIHGIGPSMAFFDTIQHGALQSTCVYPAHLHSHSQMQTLLSTMTTIIIEALQQ
eukprot:c19472_g1_i1 orf=368-1960(-)